MYVDALQHYHNLAFFMGTRCHTCLRKPQHSTTIGEYIHHWSTNLCSENILSGCVAGLYKTMENVIGGMAALSKSAV